MPKNSYLLIHQLKIPNSSSYPFMFFYFWKKIHTNKIQNDPKTRNIITKGSNYITINYMIFINNFTLYSLFSPTFKYQFYIYNCFFYNFRKYIDCLNDYSIKKSWSITNKSSKQKPNKYTNLKKMKLSKQNISLLNKPQKFFCSYFFFIYFLFWLKLNFMKVYILLYIKSFI